MDIGFIDYLHAAFAPDVAQSAESSIGLDSVNSLNVLRSAKELKLLVLMQGLSCRLKSALRRLSALHVRVPVLIFGC